MITIDLLITTAYILLIIAFGCSLIRVFIGPTLADRVVALDLIAMTLAGMTAVFAIDSGQSVYLDVVLVLAIVLFFSTVAFGRYLTRRVK